MGVPPFTVNGIALSPAGQPKPSADGKTLTVPLACKPAGAPKLTQSAVRAAYLMRTREQGLTVHPSLALVFVSQPDACIAR